MNLTMTPSGVEQVMYWRRVEGESLVNLTMTPSGVEQTKLAAIENDGGRELDDDAFGR